jgi:hypothetical protein
MTFGHCEVPPIIFFFRDEKLGWMDDGTDDSMDG